MYNEVDLFQLADQALQVPEIGAVNFKYLHQLLIEILKRLIPNDSKKDASNISSFTNKIKEETPVEYTQGPVYNEDRQLNGKIASKELRLDVLLEEIQRLNVTNDSLVSRISKLEKEISVLGELPSNGNILGLFNEAGSSDPDSSPDKRKLEHDTNLDKPTKEVELPLSNSSSKESTDNTILPLVWRSLKHDKKITSLEDGVEKLFSLFQDVMTQAKNATNEIENSNRETKLNQENLKTQIGNLSEALKNLKEEVSNLVETQTLSSDLLNQMQVKISDVVQSLSNFETSFSDHNSKDETVPNDGNFVSSSDLSRLKKQVDDLQKSVDNLIQSLDAIKQEYLLNKKSLNDDIDMDKDKEILRDSRDSEKKQETEKEVQKDSGSEQKQEMKNYIDDNSTKDSFIINDKLEDLQKALQNFVTYEDLNMYVSWPALEKAFNIDGIYKAINGLQKQMDDISLLTDNQSRNLQSSPASSYAIDFLGLPAVPLSDTDSQDVYISKEIDLNESLDESMDPLSRVVGDDDDDDTGDMKTARIDTVDDVIMVTNQGKIINEQDAAKQYPSAELQDCLHKISELALKQGQLAEKVNRMASSHHEGKGEGGRTKLAFADPAESNFIQTLSQRIAENHLLLNRLKAELSRISKVHNELSENQGSQNPYDASQLDSIRGHLHELEDKLAQLSNLFSSHCTSADMMFKKNQQQVDAIYTFLDELRKNKADKNDIATKQLLEAYEKALDSKVDLKMFDKSVQVLDQGLQEAIQEIEAYRKEETTLKDALDKLTEDVGGKLDSKAAESLRKYLEKKIGDVRKTRIDLAQTTEKDFKNAAGMRKPLHVFHCISCDRPVDLTQKGVLPPITYGLPSKRSKAPVTTYEMDQIRRYKSQQPPKDFFGNSKTFPYTERPCGGQHTTYPLGKLPKPTSWAQQDNDVVYKRELSIVDALQGKDGHIYRGRYRPSDLQLQTELDHALEILSVPDTPSVDKISMKRRKAHKNAKGGNLVAERSIKLPNINNVASKVNHDVSNTQSYEAGVGEEDSTTESELRKSI